MRKWAIQICGLVLAVSAGTTALPGAQLVLVIRSGNAWQVQEAEKISVNQKDKLRVASLDKKELRPDDYKKLPLTQILQAGIIRRHAQNFLVRKTANGWDALVPDGLGKSTVSLDAAWSAATVSIQKDKSAKNQVAVRVADIFAILPGADRHEAIVSFLLEAGNFHGVGEKDEGAAFDERMSLLVGMVRLVSGPPAQRLQRFLLTEMQTTDQRLNEGIARYADLTRVLQYVPVSEQAYPGDEAQKKVRASLLAKDAWVKQRVAILKALAAGEWWDPLIDKYGEFQRWDSSFDDMRKLRQTAFVRSAAEHSAAGIAFMEAKQHLAALKEFELAVKRTPGNKELEAFRDRAKAASEGDVLKPVEVETDPATKRLVGRYIAFADQYAAMGQFDEAEAQLKLAEQLEKSPRVLYSRANLLFDGKAFIDALDVIDVYMRRVADPADVDKGEGLRSRITLTLDSERKKLKTEITKAENEGDFVLAMEDAKKGLALDPNDMDFLWHGAIESAVLRHNPEAEQLLTRYTTVAAAAGADATKAYNTLPLVKAAAPEPNGTPNWFSGYKAPPGVFYCPISLAPGSQIGEVRGSQKQVATWQYTNGRLSSIVTVTQEQKASRSEVYFDFFKDGKAVRRVDGTPFDAKEDVAPPRFTAAGAVSKSKGTFVVLANHPVVDPAMLARLTGKNIAVIVAGNPYFNPFVWTKPYAFLAEYDDQNRVKTAREITAEDATPHVLDFKWDGPRLKEIVERGGSGYRRSMVYKDNKLMGEIISWRGKNFKIDYKYNGDRLLSAHCDDDPSLDGRSRVVSFR